MSMSIKVIRVGGSTDGLSSLRVSRRLLAHHSAGSRMGFYRLSLPVECAATLRSPAEVLLPGGSNSLITSQGTAY